MVNPRVIRNRVLHLTIRKKDEQLTVSIFLMDILNRLSVCVPANLHLLFSITRNACQHCVAPALRWRALCCQYLISALYATWWQYLKLSSLSTSNQASKQTTVQTPYREGKSLCSAFSSRRD